MTKNKLDLVDSVAPLSLEKWQSWEARLGHDLPEAMRELYLAYNGGQPQPSCVHDDQHLFPVNAFFSQEEMEWQADWYDVLPAGFELGDLLHFAYNPGSGLFALSLRTADFGQVYFYVLEEEAQVYGHWPSFAAFLDNFVEEGE